LEVVMRGLSSAVSQITCGAEGLGYSKFRHMRER
jgi:hypothetical protein